MRSHSLSTHLRQLNNYGFRKCHTERYEFGVAGFQRGSPELLKTLKRHDAQRGSRKGGSGTRTRRADRGGSVEHDAPHGTSLLELGAFGGLQTELEQLKRDRRVLLDEVVWLCALPAGV
jgi:heat shock transcription factor